MQENNLERARPLVTMVCDTYNQKDYIRQAIDGFLMQKTDFPVEILIHDDASTDGTREIVKEYASKHPDIIRTILREENMFSKDQKILEHYCFAHCNGKYIAVCEGDDYWTDPYKLQKQIGYMEAHPECTLCFTAAKLVDADGNERGLQSPYDTDRVVPTEDVIRGMGGFCPTASLVFPSALAKNRAPFCDLTTVDDAPLQIFFASRGTTYYFAEPTCVYRVNARGSWSMIQTKLALEKRVALQLSLIAMHEAFDADTDYRYHDAVEDALNVDRFELAYYSRDIRGMRRYPEQWRALPLRRRVRLVLEAVKRRMHA